MAIAKRFIIFLVFAALLTTMANAATYIVGGASGWRLGVNYTTWASGKTFRVGDVLEFHYTLGYHNVLHVTLQNYASCNPYAPIDSESSGYTLVTLLSSGQVPIICGQQDHCKQGMKFLINVQGYNYSPTPSGSNLGYKFSLLGSFALAFGWLILAFI